MRKKINSSSFYIHTIRESRVRFPAAQKWELSKFARAQDIYSALQGAVLFDSSLLFLWI